MSKTPGRLTRSGPRLGQHTDDLLRRWLDLDDAELTRLAEAGAIFQA
jgi:crotonobetainyl-CoA:carnitine CoA-transferase CaiB-like acyl-CoA transferase